ncbi:MAG: hypothetical protein ACI4PQ_07670 [Butyricicoccaceae bacterium]
MDNQSPKKNNGQSAAITLFAAVLVFFMNLSYALGLSQSTSSRAGYWVICVIMLIIAAVSIRTLIQSLKK